MAGYDDDLRFAHVLADAADDITSRRFRALDLRVEAKPDLTPVTDADHACEESLRNVLRRARPRDAVLGRRWWAAREGGAWTGRSLTKATRCRVSSVGRLADASLSYSSLSDWEAGGRLDGFLDLARSVWRTRAYGDFWSHVLVAEGAVDVSAEPEVSLWDLAALQVIVEEAGGTFTDLGGRPTPDGGSAVASNGLLHTEVLKKLTRR